MKTIIDKDFRGERMSFLQLVDKYNIVVPVIQRDYAQGRTDDEHVIEVRKNFVKNLISYLRDEEQSSHDLDFIYGTVNSTLNQNEEFIPLDGQQRLTTLFLLHWYLAGRSGNFDNFSKIMITGTNAYKFAYKTRDSSTMFCERLLSKFEITNNESDDDEGNSEGKERNEETDIFRELEKIEEGNDAKTSFISETIQNQGWFFQAWLNDPTVAGMLVMLTEIDEQFKAISEDYSWNGAYNRLWNDEKPPITFQLLPLNGYDRTDDLYIKLNARGIHLSDFENFKARIEDLMEMDGMDCEEFKKKIDVKWAEYLWKYRGGGDKTDAIMENLFRNFIAFSYRTDDPEPNVKERMDYLLEQNKKKMRFTYSRYCELEVMHRRDEKIGQPRIDYETKMIKNIIQLFDVFCDDDITPEKSKCKWLRADSFIKNRKIDGDASYHDRLRLYAYLRYCNQHKQGGIDTDDLNQWMRLINNLDKATDIDTSWNFYQSLVSVDELLEAIQQKKVQEWLSKDAREYKVTFFRGRQMTEECIKAELMAKEKDFKLDNIKKAIEKGDDDEYLTGQMGFVLEFAGAYEKYDAEKISTLSESEIITLGNSIQSYLDKTLTILDHHKNNINKCVTERLLERALLSLGMYLRTNTSKRYNFCNTSEQYNTWKTMLYVEKENKYCRDIFKEMLDNVSKDNIESDLQQIIDNHSSDSSIPEWRRLIINNKKLIDYCTKGFLYIEIEAPSEIEKDDVDVILFSQSQMNHYHSELRSRNLYESYINQWHIGYHIQKSYDLDTCVSIQFSKNGEQYEFLLSYWNGNWSSLTRDEDQKDVSSSFQYGITDTDNGKGRLDKVFKYLNDNGYDVNNDENN